MASLVVPLARAIAQNSQTPAPPIFARPVAEAIPSWQTLLNACVEARLLSQSSVQSAIEAVAFAEANPPPPETAGDTPVRVGMGMNPFGPRKSPAWHAPAMQLAAEALRAVDFSESATDTGAGRVAFVLAVYFLNIMSKRPNKTDWEAGIIGAMLHAIDVCVTSLGTFADAVQARQADPSAARVTGAPPIIECYGLGLMLQESPKAGPLSGAATPAELNQFVTQQRSCMEVLRRLLAANACGCDAHVSSLRCCSAPPATSTPIYGDLLRNISGPALAYFKRAGVNTSMLVRTVLHVNAHIACWTAW
jgi:hypothetical protein